MTVKNALKKGLVGLLLIGTLAFGGCKKNKDAPIIPPADPHAPYFTTASLGSAIEAQDINKTITGGDADGDYPLNFSIVSGPPGASISPIDNTHALLHYAPAHNESDQTQNITVRVQDSTGKTSDRNYPLPVTGVSDVVIRVKECGSGNPIQGIDVSLGSDTKATDSGGGCTFPNKLTGSYPVVLKDTILANYVTYKPKNIQVSRTEEDAGHLNLEKRLLPESHFNFLQETARSSRSGGMINKFDPNATLIFDVYKTELKDKGSVPQANIDLVKSLILNNLSGRYNHNFTESGNIIYHDSLPPPGQPTNNHIKVYWDNSFSGASNGTWTSGTRILSASVRANTSLGQDTWLGELTDALTNGDESNLFTSIRNYPKTVSTYSVNDDIIDDFYNNRPEGNKSFGSSDNRDVDP